LQKTGGQC